MEYFDNNRVCNRFDFYTHCLVRCTQVQEIWVASIDLPELTRFEEKLDMILTLLKDKQYQALPEFMDLNTACMLKGVCKSTLEDNRELYPDLNKRVRVGHRLMWHKDDIIEWLSKTDKELGSVTKTVTTKQGIERNCRKSRTA